MRDMVIYDMDKTITRKATYSAFLLHVARNHAPWRLLFAPLSGLFGLAYLFGGLSRSRLKEWNQRLFIGSRIPLDRLKPHIDSYADTVLADNIQPGALRQIAADREAGCLLMLATASYELYAEPIARRLGFDAVLGTQLVVDGRRQVQSRINGGNCYGEAKLARIKAWRAEHEVQANPIAAANADVGVAANGAGISGSDTGPFHVVRTYSDHVSDVPMLLLGKTPVAVNPHRALQECAQDRGWRIEDWTK